MIFVTRDTGSRVLPCSEVVGFGAFLTALGLAAGPTAAASRDSAEAAGNGVSCEADDDASNEPKAGPGVLDATTPCIVRLGLDWGALVLAAPYAILVVGDMERRWEGMDDGGEDGASMGTKSPRPDASTLAQNFDQGCRSRGALLP